MARREQFSVGNELYIDGVKLTTTATNINALGAVQTELTALAGVQSVLSAVAALEVRQNITEAGEINLNAKYVSLEKGEGDSFAVTLAAPSSSQFGETMVIEMTVATANTVTLALTNVVGGSAGNLATFDAVGETLVLVASGTKWVVIKELGVTLSDAA